MKKKIVAIIPARGGSRGIPLKNIYPLLGKPLIAYSIDHVQKSQYVDNLYVSTDDEKIAAVAKEYGAGVIKRPDELATDNSSTESALLHALHYLKKIDKQEPELMILLQCTSPLRRDEDIDDAILEFRKNRSDSMLSVVPNHRFIWNRNQKAEPVSINYDYKNRKRRQDMNPQYMENGSIYIFKPWVLKKLNNRLGGKLSFYIMEDWTSLEIDSFHDLHLCENILRERNRNKMILQIPPNVSLLALDFDGVMTDNRVMINSDGVESVICDRGDGFGIEQLKKNGVDAVIISKEKNPVVKKRAEKLKIECLFGIDNKLSILSKVLKNRKIKPQNVIFVGNDINDISAMNFVACGAAVSDAHPETKKVAKIILDKPGGCGAVREICDLILEAIGK